tara:strand:- start:1933 stop:2187 length:255 start_codon:yes stop_codon:yes gene_type:complete
MFLKQMNMNIKIYGAEWCSDCRVVKSLFDAKGIAYEYISITDNVEAISFVEKINNGKRIIPTMVINGKTYTNPGISKLINIITQ